MNGSNQNGNCYCWPHDSCCGSGVPIPAYQLGVDMSTNGGSTAWRNYPDVSMLANNAETFFQGGAGGGGSGTSFAAPLWAGFTALVNQNSLSRGAGLAGFLNTTLYDIGLTRGQPTDLYSTCFNDVADGGSNANGWGSASGFRSVAGYDLVTGWGSPTCALLNQLSTLTPAISNQPQAEIRFVISTGHDNLRGNVCCGCGGTGLTANVLLQGGESFPLTLKSTGTDADWEDGTTTGPMDFAIPSGVTLTQSHGIAGVTLAIHESYSTGCISDNWDLAALNVSIFNPPFHASTAVCQLALTGTATLQDGHTGLTRFSENADGSGVGQTATYLVSAGSGCP
jgi:subtilase family serine protease